MNKEKLNQTEIKQNIETKLSRYFGCTALEASTEQMYKAVSMTIRDILTEKRGEFKKEVNKEVVASLTNLNALYQDNYNYKEYLVEAKSLKFKSAKKVGPKDLSLTRYAKLERVKGQKRKLSANQYEIRFVRTQ